MPLHDEQGIRAFLAIDPPAEVRGQLTLLQQTLKRFLVGPLRWVNPEGIHLTVKFFGTITQEEIRRISFALNAHDWGQPSLHLTLESLGVFPNLRRPRVLWVGTGGDVLPLQGLVKRMNDTLAREGFAREERPFIPHWTLARLNGTQEVKGLSRVLETYENDKWAQFVTDTVTLFASELTPRGAVYTPLAAYKWGRCD